MPHAWLLASLVLLAQNSDWPGWRGPRGDGHSLDAAAPRSFGPGENQIWRVEPPGSGHSSPVVKGDALYITASVGDGPDARRILCRYEKRTGKLAWEREILRAPREGKHQKNSYASGTPAVDDTQVYVAFFGDRRAHVAAVTAKGDVAWKVSPCEFHSVHGFCTTPLLFEDLVLVNCDQDSEHAALFALERATGKVRWRTERPNHLRSYVAPLITNLTGTPQMVLAGSKTICSYDPRTGKQLWICDGPTEQCVASPVEGHGLLFITGGFPDREIMALRPDGSGDITKTHVAWRARKGPAYVPSPIVVGDHFYVVNDETGILSCYVARSGELLWQERLGGPFSASLAFAGGNLYASSEEGEVHVLAPGAKFQRRALVKMGEGLFASPAFSEGRLFLRTTKALYAFGPEWDASQQQ